MDGFSVRKTQKAKPAGPTFRAPGFSVCNNCGAVSLRVSGLSNFRGAEAILKWRLSKLGSRVTKGLGYKSDAFFR